MSKQRVSPYFEYNGYSYANLLPPIEKNFTTRMKVHMNNLITFHITDDMRKFMETHQMKLCNKKTPLKEVIFSNNVQLTDFTGQFCYAPPEAAVNVTVCIPRLVKKRRAVLTEVCNLSCIIVVDLI